LEIDRGLDGIVAGYSDAEFLRLQRCLLDRNPPRVCTPSRGLRPNRTRGLFYPSRNGRSPGVFAIFCIGTEFYYVRLPGADNRDLYGQVFLRLMDKLRTSGEG
jgi:hypothetical protein